MMSSKGFYIIDYVISIVIFGISIGIGIYHGYIGRRQATAQAYLMANRKLAVVPVTLSMVVSLMSANTLLGAPAETYNYGIQIILKAGGAVIAGVLAAVIFVPLLYPLKLTSTYEYLELRFQSRYVRQLGSVLLIIAQEKDHSFFFTPGFHTSFMCLYIGTVIIGSAVSLNTAIGLPSWVSIWIITALGSLDTALGGLKGVIWTDVFQSTIMLGGLILVLTVGVVKIGGVQDIVNTNRDWGRIFINLDVDPTQRINLLSGMVGYAFTWLASYGISQPQVQRFSALTSQRNAIIAILLNPLGFSVFHILSVFTGLVVFAYYATTGCDPMFAKKITNTNQLLVYFVMDAFDYPGLPGAFVSCLFCAALSSQSSSLNAMVAVLWEDFLASRFSYWTERKKANCLRVSVLVFGVISGALAVLMLTIGGNLQQLAMSFYAFSLGPLLGMFLLGALFPFTNAKGAFVGAVIALITNGWLLLGQTINRTQRFKLPTPTYNCTSGVSIINETTTAWTSHGDPAGFATTHSAILPEVVPKQGLHWLYSVSFVWYGMIGCVLTLVIGIIVSLITGCEHGRRIPKQYLCPLVRPFTNTPELDSVNKKETLLKGEPDFTIKSEDKPNKSADEISMTDRLDPTCT